MESNDGQSKAIVLGGTPPYTFNWLNNNVSNSTEQVIYNRPASVDSISITDAVGCTISAKSRSPKYGGKTTLCAYTNSSANCIDSINHCPGCASVTLPITYFGADGNDDLDDECAFELAVEYFSHLDASTQKTLYIPQGTYYIGRQDSGFGGWLMGGHNVLDFNRVSNLLIKGDVDGNGLPISILRLNPCMRYGSFIPSNGLRFVTYQAYVGGNYILDSLYGLHINNYDTIATIGDMIMLYYCKNITIRDLELDGNIANTIIGGGYSEGMQQGGYSGITINASNNCRLINLNIHHFGYDGLSLRASYCPPQPWVDIKATTLGLIISGCKFIYNARNGMTWGGGPYITVLNSEFSHTGQGRYTSKPAAGLDIEYEGAFNGIAHSNSHGKFINCSFLYNSEYGLSSNVNTIQSKDYYFDNCTFTGDRNSIFISSRQTVFNYCTFTGTVISHYGAPVASASQALTEHSQTRFLNCNFIEEGWVPGVGQRSFQQTPNEYDTTFFPAGHRYLINQNGGYRAEFINCLMNTNYTMRGGWFDAGLGLLPSYLNIKMYHFGMYSHGLDPRSCEINDISVIQNVSLYGWSNGQSLTDNAHLRKQYSLCSACNTGCTPGATEGSMNAYFDTLLINGVDSFVGPGLFRRAFCSPCTNVWDSVPKYIHPVDPNPVVLFSTGIWYVDTFGIQASCIGPLNFRKGKSDYQSGMILFPNPAANYLKVINIKLNSTITIFNFLGEKLKQLSSEGFSLDIDIEKFKPGVYFIQTSYGLTRKFIKL